MRGTYRIRKKKTQKFCIKFKEQTKTHYYLFTINEKEKYKYDINKVIIVIDMIVFLTL